MSEKKNQAKPSKKKLSVRRQKLVKELANPRTKSVADAARKAGFSPSTVRSDVYAIAANPAISAAVEARRRRSMAHSKVTPEEVLGSAVFNMRSSLDDLLDADGSFDIEKARTTGVIDVVKKHKETRKSVYNQQTKETETTVMIEIELESPAAARKEVANYIGLEKFAVDEKTSEVDKFVTVTRTVAEKNGLTIQQTIKLAVKNNRIPPELADEVEKLLLDA